jgi:hypothetical protein
VPAKVMATASGWRASQSARMAVKVVGVVMEVSC